MVKHSLRPVSELLPPRWYGGAILRSSALAAAWLLSCWSEGGIGGARLVAQSAPATSLRRAIVVLHDVSGSVRSRPAAWYDAFGRAVTGIIGGETAWLNDWTRVGAETGLIDSVSSDRVPMAIAAMRFGTARAQRPYFSISVRQQQSRAERVSFVQQTVPPLSAYIDGKTYVDLAEAYAASELASLGYQVVYLIILSDFQSDADYNQDQISLISRYDTQSLPLIHGTPLVFQYAGGASIKIRIVRLAAESAAPAVVSDPRPDPPRPPGQPPDRTVGSVRLLRPGSVARAGSVVFGWQAVSGAATYELAIRPLASGRGAIPTVNVSGTSRDVGRLAAGRYRWSVTAKDASQRPIARSERALTLKGQSSLAIVLLVLVVVGIPSAVVVFYVRRRRLLSTTGQNQ